MTKNVRPNTSQMTLSLTKTVSFDNREELHQENPIKLASNEIVTENLINEQLIDSKSNDTIQKTTKQDKRDINLVKFSECDNLVKETVLCAIQNQPIVDPITNVSSVGVTPTIPIVVCTVSDSEPKCMEVESDGGVTDFSTDKPISKQTNVLTTTDDEKCIPQEELSPTTDEYQECCLPVNYQYDISTEGEMLARGCVAPAPTPAPSIAPLAEVEVDPPEDELDTEEMESVHMPEVQEKRNEVKKNDKQEIDGAAAVVETDVVETHCEGMPSRNAVCPWEDE